MTHDNSAKGRAVDALGSLPKELEPIALAIADQKLPPVASWSPRRTVKIPMRIGRDGTWYYEGSRIQRPALVRLFASVLRRDPDGKIYLVTPAEKYDIEIDDAPFVAKDMTVSGDGDAQIIALQTNTDDYVIVSKDNPIYMDDAGPAVGASPYVHVRAGLKALISRPIYYQLVERAIPQPGNLKMLGVWSKGQFFALGEIDA
ncbi:MAG: DUF1285 domain-containing protein [Pseudomonadota bacterium]